MSLKLFNTLSRAVQEFAPLDPGGKKAGMYCCGPTVYDFAHIGNWRTFVFADLVRRTLEFSGYDVRHVMNITDIEDKIIKGVRENKTTLREFTGKFETAFLDDLKALNCKEPHVKPRATEYIAEIIALIEKLVARGIAYQASDGSVYFSITKYQAFPVTNMRRNPSPISRSGRRASRTMATFSGPVRLAKAGPAGTSNAAP